MKVELGPDGIRVETDWIPIAEPGAESATFDVRSPSTLICARCLRDVIDMRCLTGTCTETLQAAPPVRASDDG